MSLANDLKASLDRLVSASGTEEDLRAIQQALLTGHIVYASGERNVTIGGDRNLDFLNQKQLTSTPLPVE